MSPGEARALVQQHGTQAAAARVAGVPYSTFQRWVKPERYREYQHEYRRKHHERVLAIERESRRRHLEERQEAERKYYAENEQRREKVLARSKETYWSRTGFEHNYYLLRQRRREALRRKKRRMAEREAERR
jgi:hypothetical protein